MTEMHDDPAKAHAEQGLRDSLRKTDDGKLSSPAVVLAYLDH